MLNTLQVSHLPFILVSMCYPSRDRGLTSQQRPLSLLILALPRFKSSFHIPGTHIIINFRVVEFVEINIEVPAPSWSWTVTMIVTLQ